MVGPVVASTASVLFALALVGGVLGGEVAVKRL